MDVRGIRVRHFKAPGDVAAWLPLRERAMAGEKPAARSWADDDFRREMLDKSWWRDEWTWLAIDDDAANGSIVGAVTLAVRAGSGGEVPVVHWLLVDPAWRRHGVGQMLMSHLERAAWDSGWREVQIETHAGWEAAVSFYQSMGYAAVRDESPR